LIPKIQLFILGVVQSTQCNGQEVCTQDSTCIQVTSIAVVKKWLQQKYASKNKQTGLIFSFATKLLVHEHVRVVF